MSETLQKNKSTSLAERLLVLLPVLAALALFIPVTGNDFLNWDDPFYIYNNLHIRSLDLRWAFTAVVVGNYHPVTMLSHTLDYALFGLNPAGHHFTSILLHALNTGLVFITAKKLFERINRRNGFMEGAALPALAVALLFAFHPLHVQSIAWAAERKDVLSTFFFLLALLSYLQYTQQSRKGLYYGLTIITFILALLSKPMAITLPVVMLILDYYPLERHKNEWKKIIIEKIPFFALSAASAVVTLWAQRVGGALRGFDTNPLPMRIYLSAHSVTFYIYKLILPINLSPYYPLPFKANLLSLTFIASIIFFVVITLICLLALKREKKWPISIWAFYLITLLPVSGLVSVGGEAAADRYAYIPTMSFFILAGAILSYVTKKSRGQILSAPRAAAGVIFIAILSLLAYATVREELTWRDNITITTRAINLYPEYVAIPYNSRGLAYERAGKLQLALEDYNKAISISPGESEFYINRGIIYGQSSLFPMALKDFTQAIFTDPTNARAYHNRGVLYIFTEENVKALRDLKKAVELNPLNAKAYYNIGTAYLRLGNKEAAKRNIQKAMDLGLAEAREFLLKKGSGESSNGNRRQ